MKPKCRGCERLRAQLKKANGEYAEGQANYDYMIGILTRAYISADNRGGPLVGSKGDWEKMAREFIKEEVFKKHKSRKRWSAA